MPRRRGIAAAQEDPDAGFEEVVGDLAVDGFVGVRHARRGVGGDELASIDVATDGPAAFERFGDQIVAAFVAEADGDEVHLLAERNGFRPTVEERADLGGSEVASGGFEVGVGRGHGAGDGEENVQRRLPGVFQHPFDAVRVADVADLVAVAEERGRAIEQRRFGVGAGRHHRGFDVDMRINQAGREDAAACVVELGGQAEFFRFTGRFQRRDAAAADPDFAVGDHPLGVGGKHPRARDHEVGGHAARSHGGELAGHLPKRFDGETGDHGEVVQCRSSPVHRIGTPPSGGPSEPRTTVGRILVQCPRLFNRLVDPEESGIGFAPASDREARVS